MVNVERLEKIDEIVEKNTEGIVEEEENESVRESHTSSNDDNKVTNNTTINNVVMINVVLDREVWKVGDEVRALTEEEKDIWKKMKRMMNNKETLVIPSLKTMDKKKIKEKVIQVKGVMHNIIDDDMKIGEVKRALSVGAYLVADSLGKVKSKVEGKKEKGKPFWQRRVERNIGEW